MNMQLLPENEFHLGKVWLIDDDEITNIVMERQIARHHIAREIVAFEDPEKALEVLHACEVQDLPHLILLDINMPGLDGWQFLDAYKEWATATGNRILIFMVSSSVFQADVQRAIDHPNVQEYIVKPVPHTTLVHAIQKHLVHE